MTNIIASYRLIYAFPNNHFLVYIFSQGLILNQPVTYVVIKFNQIGVMRYFVKVEFVRHCEYRDGQSEDGGLAPPSLLYDNPGYEGHYEGHQQVDKPYLEY